MSFPAPKDYSLTISGNCAHTSGSLAEGLGFNCELVSIGTDLDSFDVIPFESDCTTAANDVCEDTADCEDAEGWDFNIGEDSATLNGNKDEAIACFRVEATTSDSTIMNVQYVKVTVSITENGDFSAISMSLADSHAWTDNAVAKTISNTLNVDIAQCSGGDPDMGDWVCLNYIPDDDADQKLGFYISDITTLTFAYTSGDGTSAESSGTANAIATGTASTATGSETHFLCDNTGAGTATNGCTSYTYLTYDFWEATDLVISGTVVITLRDTTRRALAIGNGTETHVENIMIEETFEKTLHLDPAIFKAAQRRDYVKLIWVPLVLAALVAAFSFYLYKKSQKNNASIAKVMEGSDRTTIMDGSDRSRTKNTEAEKDDKETADHETAEI